MDYEGTKLSQTLTVNEIITIHYFEYRSDFYFSGESHDFWEFLCVDKGEIEVLADTKLHILHKGNIIFHKPNEFHNVKANGRIAPNLVVIAFRCDSPAMDFFQDKVLTINDNEKNFLANIISEAHNTYCSNLNDPYLHKLEKNTEISIGSEQLIKNYLENMLIQFIRRHTAKTPILCQMPTKAMKQKNDYQVYRRVISYLEDNIQQQLTIEEICHDNLVGRSHLQKIFREKNNCGIIDHFSQMKIDAAKQLIRADSMNFTQISDYLGYTSIHYFSRKFKKVTGMTPSEYASSIKVLSEIAIN